MLETDRIDGWIEFLYDSILDRVIGRKFEKRKESFMRKGRQMVLLCIAAMLFCTALCFPKEAKAQTEQVTIETGREIYYHQYSTNLFYINGNVGYCLQPAKETPADGIYAGEVLQNNEVLAKAIYFSTGQPGEAVVGEGFWQIPDPEISGVVSWDERYAYSHMFLSWIFADYDFDAAFHGTGLENEVFYEDLKKDFQWKLEHIKGLKVPEAALSFSDSDVTAYIDSEGQRTESLVLSGDPENEIALPLREKMVLVNESRGTEETGIGHISGGEQFYLRAPIDMKETYQSGEIYGSITNEWRSLIIGTGEDTQIMGVGSYAVTPTAPVQLSVQWVPTGKIRLKKIDAETQQGKPQGEGSFEGAVYEIFDRNGKKQDTLTTDKKGEAVSKLLPYGIYTIREVKAPFGYTVAIDQSVQLQEVEIVVVSEEKPQKGIIRLQKADKEAEQEKKSPYASLKGAEYTVSSKEGTVLQTLVTDDEGKAESKPLLTGKYQVKETKAPEGYNIDPTIYQVELLPGEETAEIFYQSVSSKEEIIRGDFEIMKLAENENEDEDTLQGLAGAEFTVYEKTSGKEVIKLVTDERGFATTVSKEYPRGRLIFGTYVVKETKTPEGYRPVRPFEITIKEEKVVLRGIYKEDKLITSPITVVKVDQETGKQIQAAGVEFRLLDSRKKPIEMEVYYPEHMKTSIFKTDKKGQFTFPQKLKKGQYYLEEVKAPEGYLKGELLPFEVKEGATWAEAQVIRYSNRSAKGKIVLQKIDQKTKETLSGAVFEIFAAEDIVTADQTVHAEKGEQVDTVEVSEKGGCSQNLYLGKYVVKEKKQPEGYVRLKKEYEVELKYKDQVTEIVTEELTVANVPVTTELIKTDKKSGKPLEGVSFSVWKKEDEKLPKFEKKMYVTDQDGKILLEYLKPGTYCIQEKETLPGYILSEQITEFTVDEEGYSEGKQRLCLKLENEHTNIEVEKLDADTKKPVEGAVLQIEDLQGKVIVEKWKTEKEPKQIEKLPEGEYVLVEAEAPFGYQKAEKMKFRVEPRKEVQKITLYNRKSEKEKLPEESTGRKDTPKTGDTATVAKLIAALLGASLLLGLIYYRKRDRKR